MKDFYDLYTECFPEYPTTPENFNALLRPDAAHVVQRREDGRLLGFALVHGGSIPLLCVAGDRRGQGIGSALLAECEQYIRGQGEKQATLGAGPHYILQGVPQGPAVEFFQKRGYAAEWSSINMELPLADFDPDRLHIPPAPAEVTYRFAEPGDTSALLAAVEAAEEGWVDLFRTMAEPILLAELDGEIVGFETLATDGGYFVRPGRRTGCIGCVGVVPAKREHGIGMAMVAQGVQWLKDQGTTHIELRYTWLESWYGKLGFYTVSRQWMGEKSL